MVGVTGSVAHFRFYRPQAVKVFLVGDFNQWDSGSLPMVRTGQGYWVAAVRLEEGNFRFRYRADGQWFTDFAAFGVQHGPYGLDSVVCVGAAG